jgi:putative intracellular protease/amidase
MKVLMVLTSHDPRRTGKKTGFWLEELVTPYYVFKDAWEQITLAPPKGAARRSTQGPIWWSGALAGGGQTGR